MGAIRDVVAVGVGGVEREFVTSHRICYNFTAHRITIFGLIMTSLLAFTFLVASPAIADDGAAIYKNQCARCHGANGEGAKKYKKALAGDLSVAQLAKLVRDTMPEDNPGTLSESESLAVAGHMHAGFYSAVARDRGKLARIDLARLTVKQYRSALADLVGSFRGPTVWGTEDRKSVV